MWCFKQNAGPHRQWAEARGLVLMTRGESKLMREATDCESRRLGKNLVHDR
jgi:hypothetical protein